jgi:hypothetical protein
MQVILNNKQILLALCLLVSGILTACTRSGSRAPFVYATDSAPRIMIDKVRVNEGNGVYVSGRSTLPNGECVQTELLVDQQPASWWPRNVCIQIDSGQWEILVALGMNGAPAQLDPNAAYLIHAWWPTHPDTTFTRFPFDLKGPASP